ncbi:lipopolysaccharide kinase InaA family protein [Dysgonomonas sp. BGC7]|uniref:lipopolysaccharide kinase InaA family protein n=1 Tax=Dysgonomonas sp. BGC7 TaxID=1658008 RepID=UPI00067F984C|nr:lipopolysaccharide kinase InaA family protein [Dysgonomonas sp. BGC7]
MTKIKLVIDEKYQDIDGFIEGLPMSFLQSGEVVYSGRNLIKTFEVGGFKLNVKSFKKPLFINQVMYATFRKSKAKRSYLYAHMLKKDGFHTPDPVAYMELKKYGLLKYSLYISIHEEFDGMMRELLHGTVTDHEELIKEFAVYTARLHEKKILHLDYSSGNILYKRHNNKYTFYLVDLNRMKFNKTIDLDTACFNFRRLWGSDEMMALFAKEYAKERNFDETTCLNKIFEYRKKFWGSFKKQHPGATPYIG